MNSSDNLDKKLDQLGHMLSPGTRLVNQVMDHIQSHDLMPSSGISVSRRMVLYAGPSLVGILAVLLLIYLQIIPNPLLRDATSPDGFSAEATPALTRDARLEAMVKGNENKSNTTNNSISNEIKVMSMLSFGPPGPDQVRLAKDLEGLVRQLTIPDHNWISLGNGLLWYYDCGTYLDFTQEGPLVYATFDEVMTELVGVRLRSIEDLPAIEEAIRQSPGPLTLWSEIQPPAELADVPDRYKITSFQQVNAAAITDVSPLAHLPNLESIHICPRRPRPGEEPKITDISPLSDLTQLKSLILNGCHHLTRVCQFSPELEYLDLTGSIALIDIAPLSNLNKLQHLNLHGSYYLKDISSLANCTSLTYLHLQNCKTPDLSALENLTSLTWLNLVGCYEVEDFSPLASLVNLQTLNLGACKLQNRDLSYLSDLRQLRDLNLWANHKLTDISALFSLVNLEILNLRACDGLTDLWPLSYLTNLRKLDCLGCSGISDVTPLAHCTNLQTLNITVCPSITDISPLEPLISSGTKVFHSLSK